MARKLRETPGFTDVLKPNRELVTSDGYRWMVYTPDQIGTTLVCLEDRNTGIVLSTVLTDPRTRTASLKSYSAAKHSRDSGTALEIFKEIFDAGSDPDKKVAGIAGIGHTAIAGLAGGMTVHFHNVPMHLPFVEFNAVRKHEAQEKSTRYIEEFERAMQGDIQTFFPNDCSNDGSEIQQGYKTLGQKALGFYKKHQGLLGEILTRYYRPKDSKEEKSLASRNLDISRGFLLFGMNTGHAVQSSAREWSQTIVMFRNSHIPVYRGLADQLERLLCPSEFEEKKLGFKAEAPDLIRHTDSKVVANENIAKLKRFVETKTDLLKVIPKNREFVGEVRQAVSLYSREYSNAEKMVAQYLLTIYPGLNWDKLLVWVHDQSDETKVRISSLIAAGHNQFNEMPNISGPTDTMFRVRAQLKVDRDLNRHRTWETFVNLPLLYGQKWSYDTALQVLAFGFGVSDNLTRVPEFSKAADSFSADMKQLYESIYELVDNVHRKYGNDVDYGFIANILPLGHIVEMFMSGNIRQANYLNHIRTGFGGDFDYRDLAYQMSCILASSDKYLEAFRIGNRPNPQNRREFFQRS